MTGINNKPSAVTEYPWRKKTAYRCFSMTRDFYFRCHEYLLKSDPRAGLSLDRPQAFGTDNLLGRDTTIEITNGLIISRTINSPVESLALIPAVGPHDQFSQCKTCGFRYSAQSRQVDNPRR